MRHKVWVACALGGLALAGLVPGAAMPASGQAQDSAFLSANLYGEMVPSGGDDNATADFNAEAFPASGRICYYLDLLDLRSPTGVAIHRGGERDEGEAVIALQLPASEGEEVCVAGDPATVGEVLANPADFYVQVTSERHSGGAVRGQLAD